MVRLALALSICFVSMSALWSQAIDPMSSLAKSSKKMIKAIVEEDYANYIDMSYPRIVELYGGKDIMVKMIKENKDATKAGGMLLREANFIEASAPVVGGDNQLQSIVSFDYMITIANSEYVGINYLLAISSDEGKTWTFVELETYDEPSIKEFVPTYSDELVFPTIYGAEFREK